MAESNKFLDDYDDLENEADLYVDKVSKRPASQQKKFKARRKIEELRENKRMQQQINSHFYD